MQNIKKKKISNIDEILEEIVQCVTAPSFCVMPWKCVTMAVGDRTDPSVKKSVVHIFRTSVDGQNIFQIKVHNCKKEVCDHAICTKECEILQQTEKEAVPKEINQKKRKKKSKYSDGNKGNTIGCCAFNKMHADENERSSILKEHKENKNRNQNSYKCKRILKSAEYKERPSCTLQVFADGKTRKLNFQLHPAMKVFLGKALDRIEGGRGRRVTTSSYTMRDESLEKTSDGIKSKKNRTTKKSSPKSRSKNKNRITESVEEFEISLPDTSKSHTKENLHNFSKGGSFSEISKGCTETRKMDLESLSCAIYPDEVENNEICSENEITPGYFLPNNITVQERENDNRETLVTRNEFRIGRLADRYQNTRLTACDTHQKLTTVPEYYEEMGRKYNHHVEKQSGHRVRFKSPDNRPILQNLKDSHCTFNYHNFGMESKAKQNPADISRNIFYRNENNSQPYTNSSQCFHNDTRGNIYRSPYIVDYHNDNNELLVRNIANTYERKYAIPCERAPIHSTDYINTTSIYRNSDGKYPTLPAHETYPMPPNCGTYLTNDGAFTNRVYDTQQYNKFSNIDRDGMNITKTEPAHHYKIPYSRHDTMYRNDHVDRETQISQEDREDRRYSTKFNVYQVSKDSHTNVKRSSETGFIRETDKSETHNPQDIPTTDRPPNHAKLHEPINNDFEKKYDSRRYNSTEDVETRARRSHKSAKMKDNKGIEISNSNNHKEKPGNSTETQSLPSCSSTAESKISSKQQMGEISSTVQNIGDLKGGKENKRSNRGAKNDWKEKNNIGKKAFMLQNSDNTLPITNSTTQSYYKLKQNIQMPDEDEEEYFPERRGNVEKYNSIEPGKLVSEENVKSRQKINIIKHKNEKARSKKNVYQSKDSSKESHIITKKTQSIETTDSSNYNAQKVYIENASEKSSDLLSFCYHFPENYNKFRFFKACRNRKCFEKPSHDKINDSNDEYDTNSKFFCYPSQISWNQIGNIQQMIPNMNQTHYLNIKKTTVGKVVESENVVTAGGDQSKLCPACCKALNRDPESGEPSDGSHLKKYRKNSCNKNYNKKDPQYKVNLGESVLNNNEFGPNKEMNLNYNDLQNPKNCSVINAAIDDNRKRNNNSVDRSNVKSNFDDSNNLSVKLLKKPSKITNSHNVKKFLSNAKEYLSFRKDSSSSIRSGLKNGMLETPSQSIAPVNDVPQHPSADIKHSVEASEGKRNNDCCSRYKNQYNRAGATANSQNSINIAKTVDLQSRLECMSEITEVCDNNTELGHTSPHTFTYKPGNYSLNHKYPKDEKYRLYVDNEMTGDSLSKEDNRLKYKKNEFRILQSESECEGFTDEVYCYSSSDDQNEVAKNWVAMTKKRTNENDNRVKFSLKKKKSKSAYSIRSAFSDCCDVQKENKERKKKIYSIRSHLNKGNAVHTQCEERKDKSNNYKPLINATIALSPDERKGKEEDRFQVNQFSQQKHYNKFSTLFSNSIKSNYNKIKGLVKRNHTQQKKELTTGVYISPSALTQSQGFSTAVTSTYGVTMSGFSSIHKQYEISQFPIDDAKSDPIIKNIEPDKWQKFYSRRERYSIQSVDIDETENMEIENSSMSDVSIEESGLPVFPNPCTIRPCDINNDFSNNDQFSGRESSEHEFEESMPNLVSNCFENPMVDPKTGFRPLVSN